MSEKNMCCVHQILRQVDDEVTELVNGRMSWLPCICAMNAARELSLY